MTMQRSLNSYWRRAQRWLTRMAHATNLRPARLCAVPSRASMLLTSMLLASMTSHTYANQADSALRLDERQAVVIAIADNPSLAQMQARYQALTQIPSQVATLPDPTINFNAMNFPTDSFDRGQEAMTQLQLGFSQMFPFPGKLSLREQAAQYDAQAARYSVDELRLQLIKNVKSSWWQLFFLDRALDTVASNQTLLQQFISVANTKYQTGQGLQQDVLLAQLELSQLLDRQIQLQALYRQQSIGLNILMNRPANEVLALPGKVATAMPALVNEEALYQRAIELRPRLKQREKQLDAARSRLNLAKRDYYPDFKLAVNYGDRTGDNPIAQGGARSNLVSIMLGMKIPLYAGRKQTKAVAQKNFELQQNHYALIDEKNQVTAAISLAVTDYRQATQQFSLFANGIVPQAQQTVNAMLAGYQVSEVDFLNLVRSQMTLLNYQLQYWQALSNAKQAIARLEAAVGEDNVYE